MAWYYNDRIIRPGRKWMDDDGNKYLGSWAIVQLPTDEDKTAAGLTWVDDPEPYDNRFYWGRDDEGNLIERDINDENVVDENGDPQLNEDGTQVVTLGLKSTAIISVRQQAQSLLTPSDWMIIKKNEVDGYTVPEDVTTYRAAVRQASNDIEATINACTTLAEFMALYDAPLDEEGNQTGDKAPIHNWPDPLEDI